MPTPVSDGKLLYIVNDRGVVYALDVKTGKIVYGPERLKPGDLQRVAGPCRREDLHHERGRA